MNELLSYTLVQINLKNNKLLDPDKKCATQYFSKYVIFEQKACLYVCMDAWNSVKRKQQFLWQNDTKFSLIFTSVQEEGGSDERNTLSVLLTFHYTSCICLKLK